MRHLTRRWLAVAGVALVSACAACANRGGLGPPGGPVADTSAPRIVRISPESGSTNQDASSVQFRFNKVVSDNPGRGQLDQYFLISPWDGVPRVNWHRNYIVVRPRRRFRPNTAYSVTLLPGLAGVRGNPMKEATTTVFSTGATFPRFGILGTIFDWAAERPAGGAVVEAIARPDSVLYITVADSLGQYSLGPFGPGRYTLLGFVDRNNNRALDPGEIFDSTTVLISTSRRTEPLLAIARDTNPPRITALAREDSTTIRVTFDRGIDPGMNLTPDLFRVQKADSAVVPILAVIGVRAASDSAARRDSTRRDTTARRDTTRARPAVPPSIVPVPTPRPTPPRQGAPSPIAPPPPRPPRPAPETAVLLELGSTLEAGATYRVTEHGIRSVVGRSAPMSRTFTVPKPPPARRDTTRGRDTTRTPPRRPPASR